MPKAAPSTVFNSDSRSPFTPGAASNPNVLKRNQACHQCRRRKLKCDAKRPCGTCTRSHRNAVNHATSGVEVPPLQCTFDDVVEDGPQISNTVPKNRFERLENRINELESLLRQSEQASASPPSQNHSNVQTPSDMSPNMFHSGNGDSNSSSSLNLFPNDGNLTSIGSYKSNGDMTRVGSGDSSQMSFSGNFDVQGMSISPPLDDQNGRLDQSPITHANISSTSTPTPPLNGSTGSKPSPPLESNSSNQIIWPNWPQDLPNPDLLHHLVDVFFAFHPHAGRMFHKPSFMSTLALPPNHARFPHISVLHAICAVGSFYTIAVSQPPLPNFADTPADELFHDRRKRRLGEPDSFGEKQAKLAKNAIDNTTAMGERLMESLQANVILIWFYHNHARWADVFLVSGRALRALVPLGLNMCPPFHSISKSLRAPSIIPPARTVIEDETRRNTFWLAYAVERLYSTGNGWAMSLDDQDISQLMPVRKDQFDQAMLVPPNQRQWAHTPDLLLNHPPEQTDSFTLYIKSAILASKVKVFNLRFRALNYAGESSMCLPQDSMKAHQPGEYIDARETKAFQDLDALIPAFVDSFPRGSKNPINDNILDAHLFTACITPHICIILLHDPHADVKRNGCVSAQKLLAAARAVLEHLYAVWSTSYDITLLETFVSFATFLTGRVLIRFIRAAADADDQVQLVTFRTELEFVRIVLARVGERMPLAFRYSKMLDDILLKSVGTMEDIPFTHSLIPKYTGFSNFTQDTMLYDPSLDSLEALLGENPQDSLFA